MESCALYVSVKNDSFICFWNCSLAELIAPRRKTKDKKAEKEENKKKKEIIFELPMKIIQVQGSNFPTTTARKSKLQAVGQMQDVIQSR